MPALFCIARWRVALSLLEDMSVGKTQKTDCCNSFFMRSGEIYHYTIYHTTFYAKCQYVVYLIAITYKIWYDENGGLYRLVV